MATQGINFRDTLGYVTDGANDTAQLTETVDYPVVSTQGNNIGWETIAGSFSARNNNTTYPKIAGDHYHAANSAATYRIDLPATGDWTVELGVGDRGYDNQFEVDVQDTTTSRLVIDTNGSDMASGDFLDAEETEHTDAATWDSSQQPSAALSFTTTICRFVMDGDGTSDWIVCHISVTSVLARDQKYFRWYEDGTESGSTALAAQDIAVTGVSKGTTIQLRVGMQADGNPPTETAQAQYRRVGTTPWRNVKDA